MLTYSCMAFAVSGLFLVSVPVAYAQSAPPSYPSQSRPPVIDPQAPPLVAPTQNLSNGLEIYAPQSYSPTPYTPFPSYPSKTPPGWRIPSVAEACAKGERVKLVVNVMPENEQIAGSVNNIFLTRVYANETAESVPNPAAAAQNKCMIKVARNGGVVITGLVTYDDLEVP